MDSTCSNLSDTGLEVIDLQDDPAFSARSLHPRDTTTQTEGMRRLARAFVEQPETILQQLVDAAVDLCGADSAGISLELEERTDENYFQWVATAGQYTSFLNAMLPRYPSACSLCIERGQPQLFRVTQRFFDLMGVDAPLVTDGLLLPWQVNNTRGTIWIMAHGRTEAFDNNDLHIMQLLADFAAMGVRQQARQRRLMHAAGATAAAAMANELAHRINNPLQSLTNIIFLASQNEDRPYAKALAQDLAPSLDRLAHLVEKLLALPTDPTHPS